MSEALPRKLRSVCRPVSDEKLFSVSIGRGVEWSRRKFQRTREPFSEEERPMHRRESSETFLSALTWELRGRRVGRIRSRTCTATLRHRRGGVFDTHTANADGRGYKKLSSLHLDEAWANMGHLGCIIHVNRCHFQLHFARASMSNRRSRRFYLLRYIFAPRDGCV